MNNEITIDGVVYVRKDTVTARQPSVPIDFTLVSHNGVGDLPLDMSNVVLYLSDKQKNGGYVKGNKLIEELKDSGKLMLGAHVLDWLLEDVSRIPESWKKYDNGYTRYIRFLGTVYRDVDGDLCVRCLCWDGGAWCGSFYWLDDGWGHLRPVAVLASS